jgi:hypothetical protein
MNPSELNGLHVGLHGTLAVFAGDARDGRDRQALEVVRELLQRANVRVRVQMVHTPLERETWGLAGQANACLLTPLRTGQGQAALLRKLQHLVQAWGGRRLVKAGSALRIEPSYQVESLLSQEARVAGTLLLSIVQVLGQPMLRIEAQPAGGESASETARTHAWLQAAILLLNYLGADDRASLLLNAWRSVLEAEWKRQRMAQPSPLRSARELAQSVIAHLGYVPVLYPEARAA